MLRRITEDVAVGFPVTQLGNGSTLETLMLAADHALYRAKHNGRNRIDSADPVVEY